MYLMADLLVEHSRDRFEIFAFSYGPDQPDPWRERAERSCDRFIDVRQSSDEGIAALARSMAVDIAVDLKGITGGSRHGVFAARAAPLQLSFLGYPGTMPAPFIDYLVADHMVIPAEQRAAYAEKIIFLPDSYQPNCSVADVDKINASRREEGLPEGRFVYCCFNQNYKITPERFDTWMDILKAANDSVLWLWADEAGARHNLRKEAAARGVSQDRLLFVSMADRETHLARLRIADLFLDTGPYGAHTTASDALRAGLPVLTHPGRSFASRVAASLLQAVEMPELICNSNDQYFSRAVALAQSSDELRFIREKLRDKRFTAPLFRPDRFARNIERGYNAAYERSQLGLAPNDLVVVGD